MVAYYYILFYRNSRNNNSGNKHAVSPVPREALFYKMDHKRRGIAVIFNHEHFDIPSLKERTGTVADCENLHKTLKILGFEVSVHYDLKIAEVENVVSKSMRFVLKFFFAFFYFLDYESLLINLTEPVSRGNNYLSTG